MERLLSLVARRLGAIGTGSPEKATALVVCPLLAFLLVVVGYGFLAPALVSAKSTLLVVLGALIAVSIPFLAVAVLAYGWKKIS